MANATSMCILSPILLIVLVTMAEDSVFHVSESLATVFGCVFLLGMVAAAVFLFITYGMSESHMEHFEKECFETEYGVSGMVREKKDSYEPIFIRGTAVGVVLCILAVIPTIIAGSMEASDYYCGLSVGLVKAVYLFFFSGKYVSSGMNSNQIFSTLSAGIAFTGIAAGFVEEMVFRGVILNLLKEKWNIKVAVLIPSVLFGLVHIIGMDFSIISSLLVLIAGTMVGIMFSMVAIESGSVWNSGIVHSLWNILIIGGGLSISEKADEYSVMTYVLDSKDFVFTGGEFGIESSIIALLGYVIVTLAAICMIKKKAKV